MGNFFSFNKYDKPGPGVPKDEPEKPRKVLFFQLYYRKFWELVKLNLIFSFFNIPALLMIYLMFTISHGTLETFLLEGETLLNFFIFISFTAVFLTVPAITTGPVQAGFTYVLRNYSRQEHVFLLSDFKEHLGKNFKQGFAVSVIDFVVVMFLLVDIIICINLGLDSFWMTILVYLILLVAVIFLMMHIYIYPMIVTFELSLKHIYKNALIFAIAKFIPNLGILFLCFVLSAVPFFLYPPLAFVLFLLITVSTVGFITNFYAFPTLEKYMINKE